MRLRMYLFSVFLLCIVLCTWCSLTRDIIIWRGSRRTILVRWEIKIWARALFTVCASVPFVFWDFTFIFLHLIIYIEHQYMSKSLLRSVVHFVSCDYLASGSVLQSGIAGFHDWMNYYFYFTFSSKDRMNAIIIKRAYMTKIIYCIEYKWIHDIETDVFKKKKLEILQSMFNILLEIFSLTFSEENILSDNPKLVIWFISLCTLCFGHQALIMCFKRLALKMYFRIWNHSKYYALAKQNFNWKMKKIVILREEVKRNAFFRNIS